MSQRIKDTQHESYYDVDFQYYERW